MKMDDKLVETLKKNEEIIQVVPADLLLREWNENKSTMKTASAYAAPTLDLITARKIINELGFRANKVKVKTYANGKSYVLFKGYPGSRQVLRGTKYLVDNPKVVRMAIGPKGIAKSIKSGVVLTFVLSVGIEVIDYVLNDKATLSNFLGTVSTDIIKIGISAVAASLAATAVGTSVVFGPCNIYNAPGY
jgi:hypothetical protein